METMSSSRPSDAPKTATAVRFSWTSTSAQTGCLPKYGTTAAGNREEGQVGYTNRLLYLTAFVADA
jgi:hypothetical protein